jgi:alkylation response protein AidB-like acyl-CoA dehydrogenase
VMQAQEIVEGLRALRPRLQARADEIEACGTIPDDLYEEVVATGYLRMAVPKRLGGSELTLAEMNAVITEAARADGSVGWLAMIASHVPIILSRMPAESFDELFADGPDLRARVVLAPRGMATPVEGGYVVSGQWNFASGGPSPRYVAGGCMVMEDGAPAMSDHGFPKMVAPVLEASDVEFLDTWHVVGLRGTNSCDFSAKEVFVPASRVADLFTGSSCLDGPVANLPFRSAVSPGHVAVAVGLARGASEELAEVAATKRSMMNPTSHLGADPMFQQALGELTLHVDVAQAFLEQQTGVIWDAAARGEALDPVPALRAGSLASYGTQLCVKAIDAAYSLGGSASLYSSSPLQRRLRDIHVATQHFGVSSSSYRAYGGALAGEESAGFAF